MRKRIISMLLAIVMVVGLKPVTASAANVVANGDCGTGVTWSLDSDDVLTISGNGLINGKRIQE